MTSVYPTGRVRVRALNQSDEPALSRFLAPDPTGSLYLRSLVYEYGVSPTRALEHGRFFGGFRGDDLIAVVFLGNSRNVTTWGEVGPVATVVDGVSGESPPPRLFVGPAEHSGAVRKLFNRSGITPYLDRPQSYYELTPATLRPIEPITVEVAREEWIDRITRAHAAMTEEDLTIPRNSLDVGRLREISLQRIRDGKVWAVVNDGKLLCKMEESSRSPDGILVGGVFTDPSVRGYGYATRGIATWARSQFDAGLQRMTLHVNTVNHPAVRAYENVGFRHHSMLRMMLAY